MLVCVEEVGSFIAGKTLGERAVLPVKVHASRIRESDMRCGTVIVDAGDGKLLWMVGLLA
jgi:hypothetical protein